MTSHVRGQRNRHRTGADGTRTGAGRTDGGTRTGAGRTDGGTGSWTVGTAGADITPERPVFLAGYGDRTDRSTGGARDLEATAVAVADGAGRGAVVVGLDLLGVTRDLRTAVATRCDAEYGLPPDALLLNASHTHHGPEYRVDRYRLWDTEGANDERASEYRERLEGELVALVGDALADRTPAELRYSHARCGFGMNRRRPTPEGFALEPNPDGPVAVDVPVLFATRDDAVRAVVFGYACHPTSVPKDTEFHPDWPGVARTLVEEAYPGATAVFLQGCGADQNPYPRGEREYTDQHGRTLATAVEAAVAARGTRVGGPLRTCATDVTLEFADQPDRAELERRLAAADGGDRYARRLLAELDADGTVRTVYPALVQSIGFGTDLTLVSLPGEVPVDYANAITSELAGDPWVAGYSNGGYVYVPSARLLYEGGYEATWVFLYWRYPAPLAPATEARVTGTAVALAQRVGGMRDRDA